LVPKPGSPDQTPPIYGGKVGGGGGGGQSPDFPVELGV
jgi:hypothetical protein